MLPAAKKLVEELTHIVEAARADEREKIAAWCEERAIEWGNANGSADAFCFVADSIRNGEGIRLNPRS